MPTAVLITVLTFGLVGLLHFAVMAFAMRWLTASALPHPAKLVLALYAAGAAHVSEAGLYAIAFASGETLGLGSFRKEAAMSAMEYFYFSLVDYTSLGLGAIYPDGHLRFISGVEALNGFLLISCSASLIYTIHTRILRSDGSPCD